MESEYINLAQLTEMVMASPIGVDNFHTLRPVKSMPINGVEMWNRAQVEASLSKLTSVVNDIPDGDIFTIVKYTAGESWKYAFETDPHEGVNIVYSAYWSHTGKTEGISLYYTDMEKAKADLQKMDIANPSVYYDICPVLKL